MNTRSIDAFLLLSFFKLFVCNINNFTLHLFNEYCFIAYLALTIGPFKIYASSSLLQLIVDNDTDIPDLILFSNIASTIYYYCSIQLLVVLHLF